MSGTLQHATKGVVCSIPAGQCSNKSIRVDSSNESCLIQTWFKLLNIEQHEQRKEVHRLQGLHGQTSCTPLFWTFISDGILWTAVLLNERLVLPPLCAEFHAEFVKLLVGTCLQAMFLFQCRALHLCTCDKMRRYTVFRHDPAILSSRQATSHCSDSDWSGCYCQGYAALW